MGEAPAQLLQNLESHFYFWRCLREEEQTGVPGDPPPPPPPPPPNSLTTNRYDISEERIRRPRWDSNPHPPTLLISSPGQERVPCLTHWATDRCTPSLGYILILSSHLKFIPQEIHVTFLQKKDRCNSRDNRAYITVGGLFTGLPFRRSAAVKPTHPSEDGVWLPTWRGNWKWSHTQSSRPVQCTVLVRVRVWVHIPGDHQSVQLRNTTTTNLHVSEHTRG